MPDMAERAKAALRLYETNVKTLWDLSTLAGEEHRALVTAVIELGTGARENLAGVRLPRFSMGSRLLAAVSREVSPAAVDAALAPHVPCWAPWTGLTDASGRVISHITPHSRYPVSARCRTCGQVILRHEYELSGWDHEDEEAQPGRQDGRTVQQHVLAAITRCLADRDVLTIAETAGRHMRAILYVDTYPIPIMVEPDGLAAIPLGLDPSGVILDAADTALRAALDWNPQEQEA